MNDVNHYFFTLSSTIGFSYLIHLHCSSSERVTHVIYVFIINFKFLYYAKVQNANQQATDDGLSDRNVTSDVDVYKRQGIYLYGLGMQQ